MKEELIQSAAPASASAVQASSGSSNGTVGKCKKTVFATFGFSSTVADVDCAKDRCNVTCKNGKAPMFTWPDGKVVPKDFFLCKRGKWLPKSGLLVC